VTGAADAETGSCGWGVAAGFGVGEFRPEEGVGHVDGRGSVLGGGGLLVGSWEGILGFVGHSCVRSWR